MALFFFHLSRRDALCQLDVQGLDLPDVETAFWEGRRAVRQLVEEDARDFFFHTIEEWSLLIADEAGSVCSIIGFAEVLSGH